MLNAVFTFYDWLVENTEVMGDGPGLWCPLHITLLVLLVAWIVGSFFLFKKYKNFALKLTTVLCFVMVFFRIFRMALLLISGKQTFVEVLPWHLCHLMSFVFPIFYLFKIKKGFLAILTVTFFGGFLTFLFGDYYYLSTLSFLHIESLLLHFIMLTVVMACIATGYYKVRVKDFWQAFLGIFLIACWSMIGNLLVEDANYLYLMENGLPFDIFAFLNWEYSYLLDYVILVGVIALVSIMPFYIIDKVKMKKEDKSFNIIMNCLRDNEFTS